MQTCGRSVETHAERDLEGPIVDGRRSHLKVDVEHRPALCLMPQIGPAQRDAGRFGQGEYRLRYPAVTVERREVFRHDAFYEVFRCRRRRREVDLHQQPYIPFSVATLVVLSYLGHEFIVPFLRRAPGADPGAFSFA